MTAEQVLFIVSLVLLVVILAMLSSSKFKAWFGKTVSMPMGRRVFPGVRRAEELGRQTESRDQILNETYERIRARQEADPDADFSNEVAEYRQLIEDQFRDIREIERITGRYQTVGLLCLVAGAVLLTVLAARLFSGG